MLGYYTLANGLVEFQSVPKPKELSRDYPILVVLLVRLAIDRSTQAQKGRQCAAFRIMRSIPGFPSLPNSFWPA